MKKWEVIYSEWAGGWVVRVSTQYADGPYRGNYVDFPDSTEGVLDSLVINSYKTKDEAIEVMHKLIGESNGT